MSVLVITKHDVSDISSYARSWNSVSKFENLTAQSLKSHMFFWCLPKKYYNELTTGLPIKKVIYYTAIYIHRVGLYIPTYWKSPIYNIQNDF